MTTTPTLTPNASRLITVEFDYVPGGYEAKIEAHRKWYADYRSRGESWGFNHTPEQMIASGVYRNERLESVGSFVERNADRITPSQMVEIARFSRVAAKGADLVLTLVDADGYSSVVRMVAYESVEIPVTTCPCCGCENNLQQAMETNPATRAWTWSDEERLCDVCWESRMKAQAVEVEIVRAEALADAAEDR